MKTYEKKKWASSVRISPPIDKPSPMYVMIVKAILSASGICSKQLSGYV